MPRNSTEVKWQRAIEGFSASSRQLSASVLADLQEAHDVLLREMAALDQLTRGPLPSPHRIIHARWNISRASLTRRTLWNRIHAHLSLGASEETAAVLRQLRDSDMALLGASSAHEGTWTIEVVCRDWSIYCQASKAIRWKMAVAIGAEKRLLYPLLRPTPSTFSGRVRSGCGHKADFGGSLKRMCHSDDIPEAASSEARAQLRSSMFLAAVMRAGSEQAPVKVRNMSPNGAMVETPLIPVRGANVELLRGHLVARGTVIWSSTTRCGLRFSSEVSVKDWLAAPTAVHQQRVDEMVALVKAGANSQPACVAAYQDAAVEARSHEQLVDDLGTVVRLMQDLEADLASSIETLERHGMKLQNLDIAMQMLRAVSSEISPESSKEPVSLAKLADLRVASAKALGAG